jgi:hypothetical protein
VVATPLEVDAIDNPIFDKLQDLFINIGVTYMVSNPTAVDREEPVVSLQQ